MSDTTAISISGLDGAMVMGDTVLLSGPSASLFQDAGASCSGTGTAGQAKWTNSSGGDPVTLVMWPVSTIAAGTELRVSFSVRNGPTAQGPRVVNIEATGAAVVDSRQMWSDIVLRAVGVSTTDDAKCAPQLDGSESGETQSGVGRGVDTLTVALENGAGIAVGSSFAPTGDGCTSGVLRADGVLSVSVETAGYPPAKKPAP